MARPRKVKNEARTPVLVENNLTAAVGIPTGTYSLINQAQVSRLETVEKNLRYGLISNNYVLLSRMYLEYGLVQALIDTPVDDAFRGGVEIFSKQLDEEQIGKLTTTIDQEKDLYAAAQACKWDRLFGGAGVIVVLSDQDPASPLDIKKISEKSKLKFQPCNLWELFFTRGENGEWQMPASGEGVPLEQSIIQSAGYINPEFYQYYACKLHHSRLLKLIGTEAPSFLRGQLRGWGASMLESIVRPLNEFLKISDLTFELLDECKVDVFKVEGLNSAVISEQGTEQVRKRLTIANMQKNYQHAIALDKEDDFEYKNLSGAFAGIAEVSKENRISMAGHLRMPMNKIWGQSASGFSSGQDDLENYAALVDGQVRTKIKWHVQRMVELRCQQLFGFVPEDLRVEFQSLRIMSSEQEQAVKNSQFTRLIQARERGEITRHEFREGCNKLKLLGISLDLAGDDLNEDDPEAERLIEKAEENPSLATGTKLPGLQRPHVKSGGNIDQSKSAKHNSLDDKHLPPFTPEQILEEAQAQKLQNTAGFDRASYIAEGGDKWTRGRPAVFFEDYTDKTLWDKARQRSIEAFGREKWEFIAWWYMKHGGKFKM